MSAIGRDYNHMGEHRPAENLADKPALVGIDILIKIIKKQQKMDLWVCHSL